METKVSPVKNISPSETLLQFLPLELQIELERIRNPCPYQISIKKRLMTPPLIEIQYPSRKSTYIYFKNLSKQRLLQFIESIILMKR